MKNENVFNQNPNNELNSKLANAGTASDMIMSRAEQNDDNKITVNINGMEITGTLENVQALLQSMQQTTTQKAKIKKQQNTTEKYNPLRPYREGMEPTVPKAQASEPFHSVEDYQAVVNYLLNAPRKNEDKMQNLVAWQRIRDALMVVMGCTVALRIGDLLNLTIYQVMDDNGNIRDKIAYIKEQKTDKKNRDIPLTQETKKFLYAFLDSLPEYNKNDYLFRSPKPNQKGEYVITKQQAHRIIRNAAKAVGIPYHVGTHTLRKTCGTFAYEMNPRNLDTIQYMYNHDTPAMTQRYIGTMKQHREDMVNEVSQLLNAGLNIIR